MRMRGNSIARSLDPADGIAVFEKRFDQQHIGAMLSNQLIRFLKSMCGTANMVSRIAPNNCDQALLANDGIADNHDPAWFYARRPAPQSNKNRLPGQGNNPSLHGSVWKSLGRHRPGGTRQVSLTACRYRLS